MSFLKFTPVVITGACSFACMVDHDADDDVYVKVLRHRRNTGVSLSWGEPELG